MYIGEGLHLLGDVSLCKADSSSAQMKVHVSMGTSSNTTTHSLTRMSLSLWFVSCELLSYPVATLDWTRDEQLDQSYDLFRDLAFRTKKPLPSFCIELGLRCPGHRSCGPVVGAVTQERRKVLSPKREG